MSGRIIFTLVNTFQIEEKFSELREFLTGKPYTYHLITPFFAVENSLDGDEEVSGLVHHLLLSTGMRVLVCKIIYVHEWVFVIAPKCDNYMGHMSKQTSK